MAILRIKLSTVELVALCLSTFLQLVCLVAPGWWIQTDHDSGTTTYAAVFYIIVYKHLTGCKTMSWRAYWSGITTGETHEIIYEPSRGKTNYVVSEQVRHKPVCTSTEKS